MSLSYKDLTVVIPTICRKSIIDSIESVPKECKIIVSIDQKFYNDDFVYMISDKYPDIELRCSTGTGSAGATKQTGIDHVNTELVAILDDDDSYISDEGVLNCINEFNDPDVSYVLNSNDVSSDKLILDKKLFSDKLYEYDKWSPKYEINHLYPGGGYLMYRTSELRRLNLTFDVPSMDDIIVNMWLGILTKGVYLNNKFLKVISNDNSVNHRYMSYSDSAGILEIFTKNMYDSKDKYEFTIWSKTLINYIRKRISNNGTWK